MIQHLNGIFPLYVSGKLHRSFQLLTSGSRTSAFKTGNVRGVFTFYVDILIRVHTGTHSVHSEKVQPAYGAHTTTHCAPPCVSVSESCIAFFRGISRVRAPAPRSLIADCNELPAIRISRYSSRLISRPTIRVGVSFFRVSLLRKAQRKPSEHTSEMSRSSTRPYRDSLSDSCVRSRSCCLRVCTGE